MNHKCVEEKTVMPLINNAVLNFSHFPSLRDHFRNDHFLCEEGDCAEVKFENAFRYEIDFKAHVAQQHSKNMRRSQAKQARTIELDINLAPRHRGRQPRDHGKC